MFTPPPIDPDGRIATALRPLRGICVALAAVVGLLIVLSWVLLEGMAIRPVRGIPRGASIAVTAFAMILLLLSSRMRSNILRKAVPAIPGVPMSLDRLLAGYRQATLVSFAMLECSALAGVFAALLTGTAFYGIVLGAANLVSMATRWPRDTDVERIARGRRSP